MSDTFAAAHNKTGTRYTEVDWSTEATGYVRVLTEAGARFLVNVNNLTRAADVAKQVSVIVHPIAADGLPDMDTLTGRVAFVWDGELLGGWPIREQLYEGETGWEASGGGGRVYVGVTHWLEFPVPFWELIK